MGAGSKRRSSHPAPFVSSGRTNRRPARFPVFLGRSAQIIAARSKSARALYPPTSANLTCPLSRRRSRGRERHRAIDDQSEGRASDIIEDTCPRSTPTCRRSWPTLEASASRPNAGNSAIIWATNRWSTCRAGSS
jgi:hypothetical protein